MDASTGEPLPQLRDRLDDPTSGWIKAWSNLAAGSIRDNRVQPVEVAGDESAKV